jgi:hypothetical protein
MQYLNPTIKCPECGTEIPLTETIAAPLIEQVKSSAEAKLREVLDEKQDAERKLATERQQIALERESLEAEVAKQLTQRLNEAEKTQRAKVRAELQTEIQGAKEREQEVLELLRKTQTEYSEALKAKQAAELSAQSAKIEAQKEAQGEVEKLRELAQKDAQDAERLKLAEKDKQIERLLSQLDDAKRQAQQGSQQMQGEILELDFEEILKSTFPWDQVEPVKAGQRGGDLIQRIYTGPGLHAGTVMWEIKRTQNWGGDWTSKAKQDALNAKAEVVIIMSEATPKGIDTFGFFDGVWVCRPMLAVPLAHAIRQQIDQVSNARRMSEGKQGKAELLYDYLTGPEFRARLEGIVEPFIQMQADLESEKRATLTRWKKREKQIERVLLSATSLSGDLKGIGGREMPELPAFSDVAEDESEALLP